MRKLGEDLGKGRPLQGSPYHQLSVVLGRGRVNVRAAIDSTESVARPLKQEPRADPVSSLGSSGAGSASADHLPAADSARNVSIIPPRTTLLSQPLGCKRSSERLSRLLSRVWFVHLDRGDVDLSLSSGPVLSASVRSENQNAVPALQSCPLPSGYSLLLSGGLRTALAAS